MFHSILIFNDMRSPGLFVFCSLFKIRIQMLVDLPVQVDGEPWIQPAGHVVVLRSALKVSTPQGRSHTLFLGQP